MLQCVTQLAQTPTHQGTHGLFPAWGCYESSCNKHLGTGLCEHNISPPWELCPRAQLLGRLPLTYSVLWGADTLFTAVTISDARKHHHVARCLCILSSPHWLVSSFSWGDGWVGAFPRGPCTFAPQLTTSRFSLFAYLPSVCSLCNTVPLPIAGFLWPIAPNHDRET